MAIVQYDPFREFFKSTAPLSTLFKNMADCPVDRNGEQCWAPAVDIKETNDNFVVTADIPGVNIEDIEVTVDNGELSIKGERKAECCENKEGYHRVERTYGIFCRRFSFPDSVDVDRISAKGKNGVLEIVIPKKPTSQPKKIAIS